MSAQPDTISLLESHLQPARLKRLQTVLAQRTKKLTLVLENLYHPENVNSVLRTAECLGIQEIHLIQEKFDWKYNRNIARGSGKWLEIKSWESGEDCLDFLRSNHYRLAVTSAQTGSYSPESLPLEEPIALVFGNESVGVTKRTLSAADLSVHIPMAGLTESFNIGVSAGILLYMLSTRLRETQSNWRLPATESNVLYEDWLKKAVKFADPLLRQQSGL